MDGITHEVGRDGRPSWRVALRRRGRPLQMRFSDATFGGEAQSFAVARAWRDAVFRFVPPLRAGDPASLARYVRSTKTPWVYLLKPRRGNAEGAWVARVEGPGLPRSRTRQFGIARHGRAEAQRLAEAWLIAQLDALETPSPGVAPQTAPPVAAQARDGQFRGEDLYAIARVLTAKGNSWSAAVTRNRRRYGASFTDLQYGGEAAALAVARAWRDAVLSVVPSLTHLELRQIPRKRLSEGRPGVHFAPARRNRSAAWVAQTQLPDRRIVKRSFSVSVHGDQRARRLAEEERARMLGALPNGDSPALRSPAALAIAERVAEADTPARRDSEGTGGRNGRRGGREGGRSDGSASASFRAGEAGTASATAGHPSPGQE